MNNRKHMRTNPTKSVPECLESLGIKGSNFSHNVSVDVAASHSCPYSLGACFLTFAAALFVTSASALAILYGSRWIARSLQAVEQFVYILLGTTTLTASVGAAVVYLIATRNQDN